MLSIRQPGWNIAKRLPITSHDAAFSIEVESALDRILETPGRWRELEQDVHTCRTHMFPYAILYTIEPDSILIIAVMHLRRKTGYWRDRLPR